MPISTGREAIMSNGEKLKDPWDKAQIISGFVSSVVIAAVGLTNRRKLRLQNRMRKCKVP
jgi:hypothetical protein